jgi:hypothetical protein
MTDIEYLKVAKDDVIDIIDYLDNYEYILETVDGQAHKYMDVYILKEKLKFMVKETIDVNI